MPFLPEQVRRLALLARLQVSEAETAEVQAQLEGIFGLIEQLQAIDTRGVEPMSHPGDGALRLREDRVTETDRRELYQSVAPRVEHGLYLVPRVIE